MSVVFSTKCWGGDYKHFLSQAYERKISSSPYKYDECWLLVNNDVPEEVLPILETKADKLIVVDDYAKEALDFFKLKPSFLGKGYPYSICEFVELYLAKDFDYLVHLASDVLVNTPNTWVQEGIEIIKNNSDIVAVSPNNEDSMIYGFKNQFFSDQAYLIKVSELRKPAYNYLFPELPEYPPKAENSFERLVGRFLHNYNRYRQLLKDYWYLHPSW